MYTAYGFEPLPHQKATIVIGMWLRILQVRLWKHLMENTLIISVVKPAAMMVINIVTAQLPIPRPTAKIATKMIAVKTTVIVIVIAITTVIATRIIAENRQNPFRHCRRDFVVF